MEREEKARYFAQYINQPVQTYKLSYSTKRDVPVNPNNPLGYLLLTPLDQITDEDRRNVLAISHRFGFRTYFSNVKYLITNMSTSELPMALCLEITDYLRSKGYATSWMQYSVPQLIEEGVLRLKEK